jgi:hypothetical protein
VAEKKEPGCTSGGKTNGAPRLKTLAQKINRYRGWPNAWWGILLLYTPWTRREASPSATVRKPKPRWQFEWSSVPAGVRPLGPGYYLDGWLIAESLLFGSCQRAEVNQTRRGSISHQGFKVRKASGSDGIPNKALKHFLWWANSLPVTNFNVNITIKYYPEEWKHACLLSILKLCPRPIDRQVY